MPDDVLDRFCCQSPDCDTYGRRGEGKLLVIDRGWLRLRAGLGVVTVCLWKGDWCQF